MSTRPRGQQQHQLERLGQHLYELAMELWVRGGFCLFCSARSRTDTREINESKVKRTKTHFSPLSQSE